MSGPERTANTQVRVCLLGWSSDCSHHFPTRLEWLCRRLLSTVRRWLLRPPTVSEGVGSPSVSRPFDRTPSLRSTRASCAALSIAPDPATQRRPPAIKQAHRARHGAYLSLHQTPCDSTSPTRPPTSPAKPPKARPDAKPAAHTNATSPTGSSAECGATKPPDNTPTHSPLDKGASDSPTTRTLPVGSGSGRPGGRRRVTSLVPSNVRALPGSHKAARLRGGPFRGSLRRVS